MLTQLQDPIRTVKGSHCQQAPGHSLIGSAPELLSGFQASIYDLFQRQRMFHTSRTDPVAGHESHAQKLPLPSGPDVLAQWLAAPGPLPRFQAPILSSLSAAAFVA